MKKAKRCCLCVRGFTCWSVCKCQFETGPLPICFANTRMLSILGLCQLFRNVLLCHANTETVHFRPTGTRVFWPSVAVLLVSLYPSLSLSLSLAGFRWFCSPQTTS